jgi:tetratricopeptide (TPR) repeat protein
MLYKREKRVPDALNTLNLLAEKYPRNSLFRLERAVTLGQLKKYQESADQFESLLKDSVAYDYIPDLIHYQYGTMLSDEKKWKESHDHFVSAYDSPKSPEALVTLAHLNAGKCLDMLSKREEAIREYKLVLSRKDVFDSYDLAKRYLKKPFRPEE